MRANGDWVPDAPFDVDEINELREGESKRGTGKEREREEGKHRGMHVLVA